MADKTGNKFKDITLDNDYSVANNTEKTETVIHTAEERKRMNDDDNNTEKRLYITMLKNNAIIIKSKSGKSLLNDLRKMAYARFRTLLNQMCDCNFNKKIIMDTFKQKHRHSYLINLYGIKGSKEYGGIEKAPKSNVYKESYLAYAPFVFYNNFNGKSYFYIEMHYRKQIRCILAEEGKLTTKELNAYIIADSNDERFFRNAVNASRRIAINNASLKYPYRYSWSDFIYTYDSHTLRHISAEFSKENECNISEIVTALNVLIKYNLLSLVGMLCAHDTSSKICYNNYYLWKADNNTAYQLAKKIISLSNYSYIEIDDSNIKDINTLPNIPIVITEPSSNLISSLKQCGEVYDFAKSYLYENLCDGSYGDKTVINIKGIILQKDSKSSNSNIESQTLNQYSMGCLMRFLENVFICDYQFKKSKYSRVANLIRKYLIFKSKYYCENNTSDKHISFMSICHILSNLFASDDVYHVTYLIKSFNSIYGTEFSINDFMKENNFLTDEKSDSYATENKAELEEVISEETEINQTAAEASKVDMLNQRPLTEEDYNDMLDIFYNNIVKAYSNMDKDKALFVYMPNKSKGEPRKYARFCIDEDEPKSRIENLLKEMFGAVTGFEDSNLFNLIIRNNKEAESAGEKSATNSNHELIKINVGKKKVYVIYIPAEYYKP
ncbi:MAG: hypothetical protein J6K17_09385 [Oscillospiraceae bacterium]|nr:hypothetical protein [Oscillospiraceae bacterium]